MLSLSYRWLKAQRVELMFPYDYNFASTFDKVSAALNCDITALTFH